MYTKVIAQNLQEDPLYKDYKILPYRFIVISNNTRIPLVWEDEFNFHVGERKIGNTTLPDWRDLVSDLSYYQTTNTSTPKGISKEGTNNINDWLEGGYGK